MATELFREQKEAFAAERPFVICTVVDTDGSSPGTLGQKMLVHQNGTLEGSVGGGINEERVRQEALNLLTTGGCKRLSFDLANPLEGTEPVCGGRMTVFLECMSVEPRLIIFGAGHIGRVLAQLARHVRYRVFVADERPDFANPEALPGVAGILCAPYEETAAMDFVAGDSVVVVTPGHTHDKLVLEKVLPGAAAYVGLVSSAKKLVEMKDHLHHTGIPWERLNALFSPIGLNLGSTTPEEIAVEILAQLIAFRNGRILPFQR